MQYLTFVEVPPKIKLMAGGRRAEILHLLAISSATQAKRLGLSPEHLHTHKGDDASAHIGAAALVASGQADVAPGLQAVAYRKDWSASPFLRDATM